MFSFRVIYVMRQDVWSAVSRQSSAQSATSGCTENALDCRRSSLVDSTAPTSHSDALSRLP